MYLKHIYPLRLDSLLHYAYTVNHIACLSLEMHYDKCTSRINKFRVLQKTVNFPFWMSFFYVRSLQDRDVKWQNIL